MLCHSLDHLSRRTLMKGVLGTAGGSLVMNWGGLTGAGALAEEVQRAQKHCIFLWMNGGASQFETFDMKPGRRTGGLFRPISTNLPGVQICELMPQMARHMDQIAVIRSMRTSEVDHPGGIYLMHAGYRPSSNVRFPEIGAIVAKYQGKSDADLPSFIKVSSQGYTGSGFLGPKYQPFSIGPEGSLPPFSASGLDPKKRNAAIHCDRSSKTVSPPKIRPTSPACTAKRTRPRGGCRTPAASSTSTVNGKNTATRMATVPSAAAVFWRENWWNPEWRLLKSGRAATIHMPTISPGIRGWSHRWSRRGSA